MFIIILFEFSYNDFVGPALYPAVTAQNNASQTRTGWTAGGGVEWMFQPNWSARIEYTYYDLGTMRNNLTLSQQVNITPQNPPEQWAAANVTTAAPVSLGTVRVGVNYHCADL